MKRLSNIRILLFSFIFLFITGNLQRVNAQPGISVSFQQFYDELSPYGEWINDPEYGYIWVPSVEPDFQPYATNGHWVMTDYGNTWVSNYNWGWAPFHYGRWNYHNRFGWSWVPGYEWGPAWVHWRTGGGYYGWAPLGPGVSIGISVNIPTNYWVFVPQRYLLSSSVHRYYAPRRTVVNVYNRTTIINNTYVHNSRTYVSGPRRSEIQRITKSNVPVHRISNASRPGSSRVTGRSVEIYRPNISRNEQARPSRVTASNNVKSNVNTSRERPANSNRTSSTARLNTNESSSRRNQVINNNRQQPAKTRTQEATRENSNPTKKERPAINNSSETKASEGNRSIRSVPNRTGSPAGQPSRERSATPTRSNNSPTERTRSSAPSTPRTEVKSSSPQRRQSPSRSSSSRSTESATRPARATRA